jgi:hypothetical protein
VVCRARHAQARLREDAERLQAHQQLHAPLLEALGYKLKPRQIELQAGMPVPVWAAFGEAHQAPQLLIVPAYQPGREDEDPLDHRLTAAHYGGQEIPPAFSNSPGWKSSAKRCSAATSRRATSFWSASGNGCCSTATSGRTIACCASTGAKSSTARKTYTLQAAAALLHHDSLAPESGRQPARWPR